MWQTNRQWNCWLFCFSLGEFYRRLFNFQVLSRNHSKRLTSQVQQDSSPRRLVHAATLPISDKLTREQSVDKFTMPVDSAMSYCVNPRNKTSASFWRLVLNLRRSSKSITEIHTKKRPTNRKNRRKKTKVVCKKSVIHFAESTSIRLSHAFLLYDLIRTIIFLTINTERFLPHGHNGHNDQHVVLVFLHFAFHQSTVVDTAPYIKWPNVVHICWFFLFFFRNGSDPLMTSHSSCGWTTLFFFSFVSLRVGHSVILWITKQALF